MGRSLLRVLAGLLAHFVAVSAVQMAGMSVYPPPPGIEKMGWEEMRAAIATLPAGSFWFVLASWALGPFAGGFVAAWIAGRAPFVHAGIVGALALAATVAMLVMLPHPMWMNVAGPVAVVLATWAGGKLGSSR